MATFKQVVKHFEFKGSFYLRDVYDAILSWSNEFSLKKGDISDIGGKLAGDSFKLSKKYSFSKKLQKNIAHKYDVVLSIAGKKNEDKINGNVELEVTAKVDDSEKDDPFFNWFTMFKRRFIDVYLKENDFRNPKEIDKSLEDLKQKIQKIIH